MFAPDEEWKEGIVDLPARAAERTQAFVHIFGGQPEAPRRETSWTRCLTDPALGGLEA